MGRIMQDHMRRTLPIPRVHQPGLDCGGGISVVEGKGASCDLEADGITGCENTGGGLQIDLPAVNGIGSVTGFSEKIAGTGDADTDEVCLTTGPNADQLGSEV